MKTLSTLFLMLVFALQGQAQTDGFGPSPEKSRSIVVNGQTFNLVNSKVDGLVTTYEYAISGERYEDWTQLLTHQIINLATPVTAEQFSSFFERKLKETDPKASMEILQTYSKAIVFQVQFPRTEAQDDQIMVCLAFANPKRAQMNVIQYALKPNRLAANLAELQLKSWQGLLTNKAAVAENAEAK